jgi:pyrroline-5-carboxylate reductase
MNLGFIGTGTITSCVITGMFKSKILFNKVYISKRNKKNSQKLKKNTIKFLFLKIIRKL